MADIFVSYAREDIEVARMLADALEESGFTVFWDRRIPAGKRFDDYIGQQLQAARCVIVVWSPVSVHSSWVREEAADGRDRGILVPVRLKDIVPPLGFRAIQAANLVDWQGEPSHWVFKQLLDDVRAVLEVAVHVAVGEEVRPQDRSSEIDVRKEQRRAKADAKRKAQEEERQRAEAEAEAKRKAEEERQRAEAEVKQQAAEERQRAEATEHHGSRVDLPGILRELWLFVAVVITVGVLFWLYEKSGQDTPAVTDKPSTPAAMPTPAVTDKPSTSPAAQTPTPTKRHPLEPLSLPQAKEFYQRIITLPGAALHRSPGEEPASVNRAPVFSIFYVFSRKTAAGKEWVEVGQKLQGPPEGWFPTDQTEDWTTMLVMQYAPAGQRGRALYFKKETDLGDIIQAVDAKPIVDRLIREADSGKPTDPPLVAIEPKVERGVPTFDNKPYLMPISGFRRSNFDDGASVTLIEAVSLNADQPVGDLLSGHFNAQMRYIGEIGGTQAPLFFKAWAADKDLVRRALQVFYVSVFLTRNQLNELALSLRRIVDQAKAANVDQASFFPLLRSLAASIQDNRYRANFRTIADSNLLPAYLQLLPYRSDILQMSEERWKSLSRTQFEELILFLPCLVFCLYRPHEFQAAGISGRLSGHQELARPRRWRAKPSGVSATNCLPALTAK